MRGRCNARPGLAAANDRKVRTECSERLCRRQPNAIGGTRDQDLLVVPRHSNPRLWPPTANLLDHIRLLAKERDQVFDVIDSAVREEFRVHAQ